MKRDRFSWSKNFRNAPWRLRSHLLLLLLLGNLQSQWVGEGGGLTVGAVLHLRHLNRGSSKDDFLSDNKIFISYNKCSISDYFEILVCFFFIIIFISKTCLGVWKPLLPGRLRRFLQEVIRIEDISGGTPVRSIYVSLLLLKNLKLHRKPKIFCRTEIWTLSEPLCDLL